MMLYGTGIKDSRMANCDMVTNINFRVEARLEFGGGGDHNSILNVG